MVSLQPPPVFSSLSLSDLDLGNVKDQEACSPACQGCTTPPNLSVLAGSLVVPGPQ